MIVILAYNSGLGREELANLKVGEVNFQEKLLIVRKGKGGKDRTSEQYGFFAKLRMTAWKYS